MPSFVLHHRLLQERFLEIRATAVCLTSEQYSSPDVLSSIIPVFQKSIFLYNIVNPSSSKGELAKGKWMPKSEKDTFWAGVQIWTQKCQLSI